MRFAKSTFRCFAMLFFVLLAVPLYARTVRGVVTDGQGKPVARAAVRLKNSVTLRIRSVRTGANGIYRFTGLNPAMDYELRASGKGRSSGWVVLSRFTEGDERVVDLELK
jgi:hypothetical protein